MRYFGRLGVEFIDENGGGPGVRLLQAATEEGLGCAGADHAVRQSTTYAEGLRRRDPMPPGRGAPAPAAPAARESRRLDTVALDLIENARDPVRRGTGRSKGPRGATPADVKRDVRSVSILKDGRAVFNIAGNKYRIVVWINYPHRVVYIRFIGTHRQYDAIDAQTI